MLLAKIYLFNHLKSYRTTCKYYKRKDNAKFYAWYLTFGKVFVFVFYPFFKTTELIGISEFIHNNLKLVSIILVISLYAIDYFLVSKKIEKIKEEYEEKPINELKRLQFYSNLFLILLIIINIVFIYL